VPVDHEVRILGLDPGLRRAGWGVISIQGSRLVHIAHGVITPPEQADLSFRLLFLFEKATAVVDQFKPHEAAIEESFVNTNASSTLKLGHARAAIMLAPAQAGLAVAEYAARYVKKSVVGTGSAEKTQVQFMIKRLLPSAGIVSTDEADALAVAITHAHSRTKKPAGREI
jgi:crossover junction endodeoxyribonuclease RuvC